MGPRRAGDGDREARHGLAADPGAQEHEPPLRFWHSVGGVPARVDRRFDEVYEAMAQGFAEHRRLLIEQIERVDRRIKPLQHEVAGMGRRLDAHTAETAARFDRLEAKLDAFVDAQSGVNRRLLEYLDRQA